MKPNFWWLSPNLFSSLPPSQHITLVFYQLLMPKLWSHSGLYSVLIPHAGPQPCASRLLSLGFYTWSVLHTIVKAIFEITSQIISFLRGTLQLFPSVPGKIQSPYHSLQIPVWSEHPLPLTWFPTPLYLTPHPTSAIWAGFQTSQVYPFHWLFSLPGIVFSPRATKLTTSHHILWKGPCSRRSLSSPPHFSLYYPSSGHISQLVSCFCFH